MVRSHELETFYACKRAFDEAEEGLGEFAASLAELADALTYMPQAIILSDEAADGTGLIRMQEDFVVLATSAWPESSAVRGLLNSFHTTASSLQAAWSRLDAHDRQVAGPRPPCTPLGGVLRPWV